MTEKPSYEALEERLKSLEQALSESRKNEAALRESEHRLNTHLKNTPIGAITWDLDFKVVEWNPAAESMFGYSKAEALGRHASELILHESVREAVDAVFNKLISEKGGTRNTNENITKDGRQIICDWYNTVLKTADGQVLGVTSLVHDITERTRTEEALRSSEEEYRSTLNDLLVGVVVHSHDTSILFSNPKAGQILGLSPEQMSGKKAIDPAWNFIHEDGTIMQVEDYPVSRVFATLKPIANYIVGIKRPDLDSVIWVIVNAVPIFKRNSDLYKVIVNFVDITDFKQAELERIKLEDQLRQSQKMEAIGTLAGGIAHDFNNLLTPILGYAELLKKHLEANQQFTAKEPETNGHKTDAWLDYVNSIIDSASRAKELVSRILIISRKSAPKTEPLQLKLLLDEVITVVRASMPPSITLRVAVDKEIPMISAEPSQVYQVILNLCTNAIQAMQEKGGDLWIELDRSAPAAATSSMEVGKQDFVRLSVRDNGCGMNAATIEKIYEPFFTTKQKGEQRGTGLGLSIIASVIKQHRGYIEVDSEPESGSVFRVYFPVTKQAVTSENISQPTAPHASSDSHILLVDDERAVNEMGSTLLRELGYSVTSFTDSQAALNSFKEQAEAFHLVISDYSMPGLTGPQLLQKIKAISPHTPTLMMTGYANLATPESLQEWCCDGIIAKPYKLDQLSQIVAKMVKGGT